MQLQVACIWRGSTPTSTITIAPLRATKPPLRLSPRHRCTVIHKAIMSHPLTLTAADCLQPYVDQGCKHLPYIEVAVKAALEAGRLIRAAFHQPKNVTAKQGWVPSSP
jgi:hypothetical protein